MKAKLAAILALAVRELLGAVGLGLVVYGIGEIYVPAAFIAAGGFMVFTAFLLARRA